MGTVTECAFLLYSSGEVPTPVPVPFLPGTKVLTGAPETPPTPQHSGPRGPDIPSLRYPLNICRALA